MSPLLVKICKNLKLVRCPRSLAPTLVALPSMSLIPQLHSRRDRSDRECGDFCRVDRLLTCSGAFYSPRGRRRATARRRNEEESKRRSLILAGNAVRGEPVAHRGVFGRRGRTSFGEFLALFRQQFH